MKDGVSLHRIGLVEMSPVSSNNSPNCPKCGGSSYKDGLRRGKQSYRCYLCGAQFIPQAEQSSGGRKKGTLYDCPACDRVGVRLKKGRCDTCYRWAKEIYRRTGIEL